VLPDEPCEAAVPERARELVVPWMPICPPGASLEFLEDIRLGACGQRERSAAFVWVESGRSFMNNDPRGVGVEGCRHCTEVAASAIGLKR
jgi:hypothetical protein